MRLVKGCNRVSAHFPILVVASKRQIQIEAFIGLSQEEQTIKRKMYTHSSSRLAVGRPRFALSARSIVISTLQNLRPMK